MWKQQILVHGSGLLLLHFLEGSDIPMRFLTTEDVTAHKVNPVFWVHQ